MEIPINDLLAGVWGTLSIALFAWIIGIPAALLSAFASNLSPIFSQILRTTATAITVLPFLVILFWIHYPLQTLFGVVWPPFWSTALLLAAFVSISAGDILAGEMNRLRATLEEAALVLGIPPYSFLQMVVFPAALENSIPRILLLAITSIHITMFASLIGVEETFRVIQRINAQLLRPIELFTIMALLYSFLCVPLYYLAVVAKRRLKETL